MPPNRLVTSAMSSNGGGAKSGIGAPASGSREH
jgi:hypothetical protein